MSPNLRRIPISFFCPLLRLQGLHPTIPLTPYLALHLKTFLSWPLVVLIDGHREPFNSISFFFGLLQMLAAVVDLTTLRLSVSHACLPRSEQQIVCFVLLLTRSEKGQIVNDFQSSLFVPLKTVLLVVEHIRDTDDRCTDDDGCNALALFL